LSMPAAGGQKERGKKGKLAKGQKVRGKRISSDSRLWTFRDAGPFSRRHRRLRSGLYVGNEAARAEVEEDSRQQITRWRDEQCVLQEQRISAEIGELTDEDWGGAGCDVEHEYVDRYRHGTNLRLDQIMHNR